MHQGQPFEFEFEIDDELSKGEFIAAVVKSPGNDDLQVWANAELKHRELILRGLGIFPVSGNRMHFGARYFRELIRAVMETFDVDIIRIEETRRISGSCPGRTLPSTKLTR